MRDIDLRRWLDAAQSAQLTKNKVRKELWSSFTECIHYSVSSHATEYLRIPRTHFISLQSFCMLDGKGNDTINNDQLLNVIVTLDNLRSLLNSHEEESDDEVEQKSGSSKS